MNHANWNRTKHPSKKAIVNCHRTKHPSKKADANGQRTKHPSKKAVANLHRTKHPSKKADANWHRTKHSSIWLVLNRRALKFPNNDLFQLEQDKTREKKFKDHMSSNHFQTFMVRSKFVFTKLKIIALSNQKDENTSHHHII